MQVPSILRGESLKRLLQGAAVGAVATIVVGFSWGGWSLGSTADRMAKERSELAVVGAAHVRRRQIPRPTGRRGEESHAFEGRPVEARGRVPQGPRDPPRVKRTQVVPP